MNIIKWDYLTVLAGVKPTVFDADSNRKHRLDVKVVNYMLAKFGAKG